MRQLEPGRLAERWLAFNECDQTAHVACSLKLSGDKAEQRKFLDNIHGGVIYVNRRAGATTGAWPGVQPFGGWKGSGSTGKAGGGLYYIQQFMREQSQTIVD